MPFTKSAMPIFIEGSTPSPKRQQNCMKRHEKRLPTFSIPKRTVKLFLPVEQQRPSTLSDSVGAAKMSNQETKFCLPRWSITQIWFLGNCSRKKKGRN